MMRIALGVLAVLMTMAVVVQYNDPDGPLWMFYYGVPAVWAATAALRPQALASPVSRILLVLSTVAALLLCAFYWPPVSGWWRQDIWSMEITDPSGAALAEQAREGMGIMIATGVLIAVLAISFLRFSERKQSSR